MRVFGTNIKKIFIVFCLGILILPGLFTMLQTKNNENTEARKLATFPHFTMGDLYTGKYFSDIDTYLSDNFGFRQKLVTARGLILHKLGIPPTKKVIVGEKNHYFIHSDALDHITGRKIFSEKELNSITQKLIDIESTLQKNGIQLIFLITPDKHSIYTEELPWYITPAENNRTDQIIAHLQKKTQITVVDIRDELRRIKNEHELYYYTDTHWTDYAAFITSVKVLNQIKGVEPESVEDFYFVRHETYRGGGDLARLMGIKGYLYDAHVSMRRHNPITISEDVVSFPELDKNLTPVTQTTQNKKGPRLLVYHDSFIEAMKIFLTPHFSRSTYIPSIKFSPIIIQEEKPNVVIIQVVERRLSSLLEL